PNGYWGHIGGVLTGLVLALVMRLGSLSTVDYSIQDAIAKVERGQLKGGLQALHAIARRIPSDRRATLALARAYAKIWDQPAAAAQYSAALQGAIASQDVDEAWAIWKEAVTAGIKLPVNQVFALARICTQAGLNANATELYGWIARASDQSVAAVTQEPLPATGAAATRLKNG
nr:hypothetical protein [Armatimonadota bacterium]